MQTQQSFQNHHVGTLYLVPTPIGNLNDMTFRAVATLQSVDIIAAEDTRNTQKLLNHFEIKTPQISFHEHNAPERIPNLLTRLQNGESIAQVSDAGMPSISDPGHDLVMVAIANDIPVVPLPGANAGLTALIASGINPQPFLFWGFLPRKHHELVTTLTNLKNRKETMIFYEAPHRLLKTLHSLAEVLGESRQISVCRELTKRYEEFIRGNLGEIVAWAQNNQIRGEFVLIVAGNDGHLVAPEQAQLSIEQQVNQLIAQGNKPNAAIKQVAKQNQLSRQVVYNEYHHLD